MLETIYGFFTYFEVQALVRIILAAFLAGLIGYEREAWKKPAGFRTHILVCESAVLAMLCGIYLRDNMGSTDPARLPAQLLTGMGFIGAGTILRDGFHVKGLTTAASLLAVTGIGLLVGCGAYVVAIIATMIVYIILSYTYFVNSNSNKVLNVHLVITTKKDPKDALISVQRIIGREEINVKSLKVEDKTIRLDGKATEDVDMTYVTGKLLEIDEVTEVVNE